MAGGGVSFLAGVVLLIASVHAEEPVSFVDPNLKTAVEDALWVFDPTPADMLALTTLHAGAYGIHNLTGLEYATNLEDLVLRLNTVTDVSPLSGLVNLQNLVLHRNPVSDISPLSGLIELRHLNLDTTAVSDISALAGMKRLEDLNLYENGVSDISALVGLTSLVSLDVRHNPLSGESYDTCIPQILANNPGISFLHDTRGPYHLTLSSGPGGDIVRPGEGEFVVSYGPAIEIEARADPGFVFAGFTGNVSDSANPLLLQPTSDLSVVARFVSVRDLLYVDGDPTNGSYEDGTPAHPFHTIQEAIQVAGEGVRVVVRPGVYRENIDFLDRNVHLTSFDPAAPCTSAYPVLDGNDNGPVVAVRRFQDATCVVEGFVITRGRDLQGGAIHCYDSSPTFRHCLIAGNRSSYPNGAAIHCINSSAAFVNCTCTDNYAGLSETGLHLVNSNVTLLNSVFWGAGGLQIVQDKASVPSIRYCDIRSLDLLTSHGVGNMDSDPLFARPGSWVDASEPAVTVQPGATDTVWVMGDYHLKSQAGRWDPLAGGWVMDSVTSPCVDAGDPASSVEQEPAPNGGQLNLGVYGGTAQAGKSIHPGS